MEGIISGAFEELVLGMSYGTPPTAQHLKDRVSSTFFPRGANTYSPSANGGTNLIAFTVTDPGYGFIDLSSIRMAGQLNNTGTGVLNFPHPAS